ncbi:hypothetical protein VCHENC02_3293B, partial [Vibrio harveyi]
RCLGTGKHPSTLAVELDQK